MTRLERLQLPLPDITNAVHLLVTAHDGMIIDFRAKDIRQRDLESQNEKLIDAPAVLVDLTQITALDAESAFELLVTWIFNLQDKRERTGKEPIPIIIRAKYLDILRNVHAALRDGRETAFALIPGTEKKDELVQIGWPFPKRETARI